MSKFPPQEDPWIPAETQRLETMHAQDVDFLALGAPEFQEPLWFATSYKSLPANLSWICNLMHVFAKLPGTAYAKAYAL